MGPKEIESNLRNNKYKYLANGELIQMAPDLMDLPEFDWDAPEAQAWIESEDRRLREKYCGMTHEDLEVLLGIREEVLKQTPQLSLQQASEIALRKFREKEPTRAV